jgi:hypothetical protein
MNGADYWQQQQLEEQLQWFMQNTDKFNEIFGAKDEQIPRDTKNRRVETNREKEQS